MTFLNGSNYDISIWARHPFQECRISVKVGVRVEHKLFYDKILI